MKKSAKIIIAILSAALAGIIAFEVVAVYNRNSQENNEPAVQTQTQTQTQDATEKAYSDPAEKQAREMIENMTLYEKVGQMLLYYIPKEEPLMKMRRWQFGGYILFSRNFENSTPQQTREEIAQYQDGAKIPAFIAVDEEGGGVNRVSQYSQYRSEPFASSARIYARSGWQGIVDDAKDKSLFLKDLGINTVLAPVADVPYSRSDYIYGRAFSTNAD
ncbi:MAG: glycoside hydrolase family 3 N-terminal domain-containing protein, partial [Eubacterium sp.]